MPCCAALGSAWLPSSQGMLSRSTGHWETLWRMHTALHRASQEAGKNALLSCVPLSGVEMALPYPKGEQPG